MSKLIPALIGSGIGILYGIILLAAMGDFATASYIVYHNIYVYPLITAWSVSLMALFCVLTYAKWTPLAEACIERIAKSLATPYILSCQFFLKRVNDKGFCTMRGEAIDFCPMDCSFYRELVECDD